MVVKLANGKIVLCDFSALKAEDFPFYELTQDEMVEQLALCSNNGRIFLNDRKPEYVFLKEVWLLLLDTPVKVLRKFEKMQKKKFRHIKSIYEIDKLDNDSDKCILLGAFMVPLEIQRREIEARYYGLSLERK